jgi:hypothetical protein
VERTIEISELPQQYSDTDATAELHVVYVPPETEAEWERIGAGWKLPVGEPAAEHRATISALGDVVSCQPGLAVVRGTRGLRDDVLMGLIEFAFYESELRSLEERIEICESQAKIDAPRTFRILKKDAAEWSRFGKMMEDLAQLRLSFAALEPKVERGSRVMSQAGRRVATRLFRASETVRRMEGLDGRLEVCEELYEGAVDRIADYRGWHTGHVLEVIIIALLLLEACLMAAELLVR